MNEIFLGSFSNYEIKTFRSFEFVDVKNHFYSYSIEVQNDFVPKIFRLKFSEVTKNLQQYFYRIIL